MLATGFAAALLLSAGASASNGVTINSFTYGDASGQTLILSAIRWRLVHGPVSAKVAETLGPQRAIEIYVAGAFVRRGHTRNVAHAHANNADPVESSPVNVAIVTGRELKKLKKRLKEQEHHK